MKTESKRNLTSPADTVRPYERPRILHRESLEAMAAECTGFPGGKSDPTCAVGFS
ncbi:MAG: hypothetical protein AAGE94_17325 [Acidobacteriota bacterium]